jgi:hypothetical protein
VPLYGNDPVDCNKKVNEPDTKMRMADYIDQLLADQTKLRIFLYNIMKRVPSLRDDILSPTSSMGKCSTCPKVIGII